MPTTKCGFDDDAARGISGSFQLAIYGPTLLVDIGFDANYNPATPTILPVAGRKGIHALVDTGAAQSCIDSLLAASLNLPIVDRKPISGVHGNHIANMHLAQVFVPALNFTIYGMFAGVDLIAGGQVHGALIGRAFLQSFTMVCEGRTGTVTISSL